MEITEKQQNQLKEVVRLELLKRGFTAEIQTFEIDSNKRKINFETSKFQTLPVIFKECYIASSGSNINHENGYFRISINFFYKSFDNGLNRVELFAINGTFSDSYNDIFDLRTYIYQ